MKRRLQQPAQGKTRWRFSATPVKLLAARAITLAVLGVVGFVAMAVLFGAGSNISVWLGWPLWLLFSTVSFVFNQKFRKGPEDRLSDKRDWTQAVFSAAVRGRHGDWGGE